MKNRIPRRSGIMSSLCGISAVCQLARRSSNSARQRCELLPGRASTGHIHRAMCCVFEGVIDFLTQLEKQPAEKVGCPRVEGFD
jgi:hypothetical protein